MSAVEWLLVIFFVIPIILLCGLFLYGAGWIARQEANDGRQG